MKKIFICGVVIGIMALLSPAGFCAPTGNPNDVQTPQGPGLFNMQSHGSGYLKVGGDFDFIFSRKLDTSQASVSSLEITDEHWYMSKISYNMFDRIDAFVLLGGADLGIEYGDTVVAVDKVKGETSTDFAWGIGGKVFIYEFPDWKVRLSAHGLYRHCEPEINKLTVDGVDMLGNVTAQTCEISEWQFGANLSKELHLSDSAPSIILVPYIGVMYADSSVKSAATAFGVESTTGDAENKIKIGLPVGADLLIGDNVSIYVEGEFIDQTAISTGVTIKL